MENQEPWDPTFPAGYTLSPKAAYGDSVSTRQNPGTGLSGKMAHIIHLGHSNISSRCSNCGTNS